MNKSPLKYMSSLRKTPFNNGISNSGSASDPYYLLLSNTIKNLNDIILLCSTGNYTAATPLLTDSIYTTYINKLNKLNKLKQNPRLFPDYENIRTSMINAFSSIYEGISINNRYILLQTDYSNAIKSLQNYINLTTIVNSISGQMQLFVSGNYTDLLLSFTPDVYRTYLSQLDSLSQSIIDYPNFELIRSSLVLAVKTMNTELNKHNELVQYIKDVNSSDAYTVINNKYKALADYLSTLQIISYLYYTGNFEAAAGLLTQSHYETLSLQLSELALDPSIYPDYGTIRTFVTQGLAGLYQAIVQYTNYTYLQNELAAVSAKASILNDMTALREYIENLSGSTSLFPDVNMTSIAATLKPEYAEYIRLYGFPEGSIFEMDKLAIALKNIIPD